MKILFELRMSSIVSKETARRIRADYGQERINHIAKNLKIFFEKLKLIPFNGHEVDIYLTDNTVDGLENLPQEIKDVIGDNEIKYFLIDDNTRGCREKGVGVMDLWRKFLPTMNEYDYHVFFSPRMELVNVDFFKTFFQEPKSKFIVHDEDWAKSLIGTYKTAYFCVKTEKLVDLIENNENYTRRGAIEKIFKDTFEPQDDVFVETGHYAIRKKCGRGCTSWKFVDY